MSPHDDAVEVVLGPAIDLHPGIHGTFLDSPPPGFSYAPADATHVFLFPGGSGYPNVYETPHWGEYVSFARPAPLVHTARWPALNARAWIADMDNFGYPVLAGRPTLSAGVRRRFLRDHRRPEGLAANHPIRLRLVHMLRAYAHPSCRAVLFRTRHALDEAAQTIHSMGGGADGEAFLDKCQVLGPALIPIAPAELEAKWLDRSGTNVLFCGNDWRIKNGPLAVRVLARLAAKYPTARFVYLGITPPEYDGDAGRSLPTNLRLLGSVRREHARTLFAGAHVLFHPGRSESFGMVLLEAAAAGLAIVCGGGKGMQHLGEIVAPGGAAILDRDVVPEHDEEAVFEQLVEGLLADRRATRAMGLWNHDRIEKTTLSLRKRNVELAAVYRRAIATAAPVGLREEDVSMGRMVEIQRMSGKQVEAAERDFRSRACFDTLSVSFQLG